MLVGDAGKRIEPGARPAREDNPFHRPDAMGGTMNEPREVEHEPQVLEGDDDVLRQPASPLDPYTPEPHARPGERRAWRVMRLAWIPILIAVAVVVWAAVR
jgi:hypothetical protein